MSKMSKYRKVLLQDRPGDSDRESESSDAETIANQVQSNNQSADDDGIMFLDEDEDDEQEEERVVLQPAKKKKVTAVKPTKTQTIISKKKDKDIDNVIRDLWIKACKTIESLDQSTYNKEPNRSLKNSIPNGNDFFQMVFETNIELSILKKYKDHNLAQNFNMAFENCKSQICSLTWHKGISYQCPKVPEKPESWKDVEKFTLLENSDDDFHQLLCIIHEMVFDENNGLEYFQTAPFAVVPSSFDEEYLKYLSEKIILRIDDNNIINLNCYFIVPVQEVEVKMQKKNFKVHRVKGDNLKRIIYKRITDLAPDTIRSRNFYINMSMRKDCEIIDLFSNNPQQKTFALISLFNCTFVSVKNYVVAKGYIHMLFR